MFPMRITIAAALLFGAAVAVARQEAPAAPAKPAAPAPKIVAGEWHKMFDGKSLDGWKEAPFLGKGTIAVRDGSIIIGKGAMTGVNYDKPFPKVNYELRMEAARLQGDDFFATITFPVGDAECSWVNGGWGGTMVGLSSIDSMDASENETSTTYRFQPGQFYKLLLRVTPGWIQAWINDEKVIEANVSGRQIGVREGTQIELSAPLGIATYSTVGAIRNVEYREWKQEAQ